MIQIDATPPLCFPHAVLAEALAQAHDEHPAGNGVGEGGTSVILYVSRNGATWTLVVRKGPVSCVATVGRDWSPVGGGQPGRGA